MKTILELREEAIKEDKNPEFYLYQKLEEITNELQRKDNIINELKEWLDIKEEKETVGTFSDVLDKIKELENGNK